MSKHLLFVMVEGGGNVAPQLGIARRLAARGHRVRVLSDPAIAAEVASAGLEFASFRHAPHQNIRNRAVDKVRDWAETNPVAQLRRITSQVMFGPAEAYARDVLDALEAFPADALAVDYMLAGALIGAERSGLPTALLVHTPYPLPAAGVPPFGLGLMPARSIAGRVRDAVLGAFMTRMFNGLGLVPLNAARARLDLPALATVYDQLRKADKVLVMTSQRFDFAGAVELPAKVRFVGPGLDDPTWVAPWTPPWRDATPDPLVVVGLGSTFQNQRALTQKLVDALSSMRVRGLITLGDVFDPAELTLPEHVYAVRSAPHRQLFPHASCVVAHGGHGTVMKALASGVPLLCVPLGRDQADNAARVVASGSGLRLKASASVAELRQALTRLIEDPAFARSAARLASDIAMDVARDGAVLELEAIAATAGRPFPSPAPEKESVCPE
jgi:UDP:flavonoid glycosyltransferase YjiC (YdhE family)